MKPKTILLLLAVAAVVYKLTRPKGWTTGTATAGWNTWRPTRGKYE